MELENNFEWINNRNNKIAFNAEKAYHSFDKKDWNKFLKENSNIKYYFIMYDDEYFLSLSNNKKVYFYIDGKTIEKTCEINPYYKEKFDLNKFAKENGIDGRTMNLNDFLDKHPKIKFELMIQELSDVVTTYIAKGK